METQTEKIYKFEKSCPVVKARIIKEPTDDTYVHINKVSFQQNFKALIGHFKKEATYNYTYRN